jgi:hypothetical protein
MCNAHAHAKWPIIPIKEFHLIILMRSLFQPTQHPTTFQISIVIALFKNYILFGSICPSTKNLSPYGPQLDLMCAFNGKFKSHSCMNNDVVHQ